MPTILQYICLPAKESMSEVAPAALKPWDQEVVARSKSPGISPATPAFVTS